VQCRILLTPPEFVYDSSRTSTCVTFRKLCHFYELHVDVSKLFQIQVLIVYVVFAHVNSLELDSQLTALVPEMLTN
jgi:hypothetical protein